MALVGGAAVGPAPGRSGAESGSAGAAGTGAGVRGVVRGSLPGGGGRYRGVVAGASRRDQGWARGWGRVMPDGAGGRRGCCFPGSGPGLRDGGGRCPRGQGGKGAMLPGVGLEEGWGAAPREWAGALSVCGALPAGTGGGWAALPAGVGEGRGRRGGLCEELESGTCGGAGFAGNWKVKLAAGRARRLPGRAGAQQRRA